VVTDDRPERDEPGQTDGRNAPPRPATAAARRERRTAGTRGAGNRAAESRTTSTRPGARTDAKPAGKRIDGQAAIERTDGRTDGPTDVKGRPTRAVRREERSSLLARIGRFLREVVSELRKVIWPTRKELVTYTLVVLVFVSFMVAVVALLDIAFGKGVFWLFG
jgi:preprotein translocase subunit SecE